MIGNAHAPLTVPGDRPERFAKAAASGADAVVIDLEDAVAPDAKGEARSAALTYIASLDAAGRQRTGIRVNAPSTEAGISDLAVLCSTQMRPGFLVIPKVETSATLQLYAAHCENVGLLATIESVAGLRAASAIASAPNVTGLVFGGLDFSIEIGAAFAWEPLLFARSTVVAAAAGASIAAFDVPFLDTSGCNGLAEEASRVRALGFTGKMTIHPRHVADVLAAFAPSEKQVAHSRALLAAAAEASRGAFAFQGRMVDEPVLRNARRILRRAGREA
ncbi:HpcH/HpaI aldolase/citrate lyase family protein [Mesorhizobium sp. ArgA1]